MRPTSRALTVIVFLLVVAAGVLVCLAAGAVPAPEAIPPTPSTLDNLIDDWVTPGINFLGSHPYVALAGMLFMGYIMAGSAILATLHAKYPDHNAAPFWTLVAWNLLEITCMNFWRLQRRYWPGSPIEGPDFGKPAEHREPDA